jgi:hypothetical protein
MQIRTHPESQARMTNASEKFVARQERVRKRSRRVMRRRIGSSAMVISVQSRAMKAAIKTSVESRRFAGKVQIYAVEDECRCKPSYWRAQLYLSVIYLLIVAHRVTVMSLALCMSAQSNSTMSVHLLASRIVLQPHAVADHSQDWCCLTILAYLQPSRCSCKADLGKVLLYWFEPAYEAGGGASFVRM